MNQPLVVPRSVASVLRVTGEDAFAYLQSQFSNDLRGSSKARRVTYGLWLTRKGRVVADSLVLALGERDFLLLSYYTEAQALMDKVTENIIADEVEMVPLNFGSFTVAGAGSAEVLAACGLPVPEAGGWTVTGGAVVACGRRGGISYDVVFLDAATADELLARVAARHRAAEAVELESWRVAHGVAAVPADCGPGDLPQEAGLETDAVCFDKGCYLGQEVMARLKAQGRPTRHMARVLIPAGVVPESLPAKLFSDQAEAGEIRSQSVVDGHRIGIALLRDRVSTGIDFFALTPGGDPVVGRYPSV